MRAHLTTVFCRISCKLYSVVASCIFVALSAGSTFATGSTKCFVIGDTSGSNPSKPLGTQNNPYGSLADVEADTSCETIFVLFSEVVLDGGISLDDGQKLQGLKGPGGALPVLSNSTDASNDGHGIVLGADNTIIHLHVMNTYNSGVLGGSVGRLTIQDSVITGFGQSEILTDLIPQLPFFPTLLSPPGILISSAEDADIRIKGNELGKSNSTSVFIRTLDGNARIEIENTEVSDQGHVPGAGLSPGIAAGAFGDSSMDVKVLNSSVSDIGGGLSNSDGITVFAYESSFVKLEVDGYSYSNPDGDGGPSATGLEFGNLVGVGSSIEAKIQNSTFQGGTSDSIQAQNIFPGFGNSLSAQIHDNEIHGAGISGILVRTGIFASFGRTTVTIEDNLIIDATEFGFALQNLFEQQTNLEVLLQRNTIINSGIAGLLFFQNGPTPLSLSLDAGLGSLGSEGKNRIVDNPLFDVVTDALPVSAAGNWWGSAAGPSSIIEINGGSVDYTPYLTRDPKRGR